MGFPSGMGNFIRDDTFVATSGRSHGRRGELGGRSDRVDRAIERPPSDEPPWRRLAATLSPKPAAGDIENCTQRTRRGYSAAVCFQFKALAPTSVDVRCWRAPATGSATAAFENPRPWWRRIAG